MGGGTAEFERCFRRHRLDVRHAPYAVGSKNLFALLHLHFGLIFVRSVSVRRRHSSLTPRAVVALRSGNFPRSAVRWMTPPQSLYSPRTMSPHLLLLPLTGVR